MKGISNRLFGKQVLVVALVALVLSTIFIFMSMPVLAAPDVNEVSGRSSTSQSSNTDKFGKKDYDTKSDVDGLKDAFDTARVDNKDLASATQFASPFVKAIKYIIAVITAVFTVLLGLVTMLDLLYLAVPPVRNLLCKEQPQAAGGMGGGMGMGMGMGMGRMGMGGMGGAPQPAQSGIGRFVSDEAVAALAEATQQAQGAAGGMGGGMGMGMGGMGMGGMGMGAQQAKPKTKSVILTYLKKRAFAVVMFVVCLVLFTSTLFTDLGLYIGQWIIDIFNGLF